MRNIGLLVTQTHGTDETLKLGVATGEVGSDKGRFRNHALPSLLVCLLTGLDDLEHLLFADTADLGQGDAELGSLLGTLVLDGRRQSLGGGWVRAVQQVGGHGRGWLLFVGRLDVALFVCLDGLLHLDLFVVALLLEHLGAETAEVLGILRYLVALTSGLLSESLFVIQSTTVEFPPSLHILVLRLQDKYR